MGRKAWREIRAEAEARNPDLNPQSEAYQRVAAAARDEEERFCRTLAQLRKARVLTQGEVAERLEVSQPEVSQLEKRSDVYLSTLAKYVGALGGRLRLQAEFEGRTYDLELSDLMGAETAPAEVLREAVEAAA